VTAMMSFNAGEHRMDFNLVQCIVEPENIGCSSNSSCSSDAAASSTESDGDAPVIVVSHSRSHLTITAKLSPYLNQKQWLNSAGIDQSSISSWHSTVSDS